MEMLVVVAIIVALASLGGYFFIRQFQQSQEDIARTQIKGTLTSACKSFFLKHNRWPTSLEELLVRDQATGFGPFLEDPDALKDPWGQMYQYNPAGTRNGEIRPDIWTISPDQREIGNWSVLRQQQ
jgi:type II secretory pathway pseudopilin PulG